MNYFKILLTILLLSTFGLFTTMTSAVEHSQLKAFPLAKAGMQSFVIELPLKERGEEDAFKVELLPGKMMTTDCVNLVHLGTRIEAKPLKGWGYTYYEVTGKDISMSTMMGVPAGTQSIKVFVAGQSLMIRYNSRLPIVIYAPQGHQIKYRIWRTDDEFTSANTD